MAFTKSTVATNNISNLADQPTETATQLKALFDKYGADDVPYVNALIDELEDATNGTSGSDSLGMTQLANNGSATETAQAQVEALDVAVGDRAYTEQNYVTDSETVTASIDALDQQLKDENDASVKITGNQTIAGIKTFASVVKGITPIDNEDLTTKAYADGLTPASTPRRLGGGLLINGNFDVWQRGTGPFVGAVYGSDRWEQGANGQVDQSTDTPDFNSKYSAKISLVSGGPLSINFQTKLENQNNVLYNKECTLSFYVKSNFSGTMTARLRNETQIINIQSVNYSVSASWTKVVITFSASASWVKDDIIRLNLISSNSLNDGEEVYFSQVKLEPKSFATEFVPKTLSEEFSDCLRYFRRFLFTDSTVRFALGQAASSTVARVVLHLSVIMRIKPTASFAGNFVLKKGSASSGAVTNITIDSVSSNAYILNVTATALTDGDTYMLSDSADTTAYLDLDSEL